MVCAQRRLMRLGCVMAASGAKGRLTQPFAPTGHPVRPRRGRNEGRDVPRREVVAGIAGARAPLSWRLRHDCPLPWPIQRVRVLPDHRGPAAGADRLRGRRPHRVLSARAHQPGPRRADTRRHTDYLFDLDSAAYQAHLGDHGPHCRAASETRCRRSASASRSKASRWPQRARPHRSAVRVRRSRSVARPAPRAGGSRSPARADPQGGSRGAAPERP